MTSRDFCYWLQGFFEISEHNNDPEKITLTKEQVESIKKHLNMAFRHEIDPSFGKDLEDLTEIHGPKTEITTSPLWDFEPGDKFNPDGRLNC